MSTQTSHYNLTKPELNDTISADIPALAANFETIDTQLYNANSKVGVPSGGTTGQVLTKTSESIAWQDPSGGSDLPSGGNNGQVLTKVSGSPAWADVPAELPNGGSNGQVLTKTSNGVAWQTPSGGGSLPSGGFYGQYLQSDGDGGATWEYAFPTDGCIALLYTGGSGDVHSVSPGSVGQVLSCKSEGFEWIDFIPSAGTDEVGKVLMVTNGTGAFSWEDVPSSLPSDGSHGDVLAMGANAPEWIPKTDVFPSYDHSNYGNALMIADGCGGYAIRWSPVLPTVDNTDVGKVLMVNSTGEWVAATLP